MECIPHENTAPYIQWIYASIFFFKKRGLKFNCQSLITYSPCLVRVFMDTRMPSVFSSGTPLFSVG